MSLESIALQSYRHSISILSPAIVDQVLNDFGEGS